MAASAGYIATLKVSGTPVSFTGEPTTKKAGTTIPNSEFRITDATRRVLDPDTAITVEVDPEGDGSFVTASAASYTVDALDGRILFATDQGSTAVVRVTAAYLPTADVIGARGCDLSFSNNLLDSTTFASAAAGGGHDSSICGIQSFSLSVDTLGDMLDAVTSEPGDETLAAWLLSRTPRLVEFKPTTSGRAYRGWVLVESGDVSGAVDDLATASITLHGTVRPLTGRSDVAAFTIALP